MDFFKRLFGLKDRDAKPTARMDYTEITTASSRMKTPAGDAYYDLMAQFYDAEKAGNYEKAGTIAHKAIPLLKSFVKEVTKEYGRFDITEVFPLGKGGMVFAVIDDAEGIAQIKTVVESVPALNSWREEVQQHEENRVLVHQILDAIRENPGCLQTSVKKLLGIDDGRRVAGLLYKLDKSGRIIREKSGRSYMLNLPISHES